MDPNLFPMPGPSKRRDDSDDDGDNFHKKPKTDEEIDVYVGSKTIDDLPEEILITLFKYLPFQDRLQAQKVCSKWQNVGKTEILWRCAQLSDISVSQFDETFQSLTSCLLHFELKSQFPIKLNFSFLEFLIKLRKQCPSLKTLILGNINFEGNSNDKLHVYSRFFAGIKKAIDNLKWSPALIFPYEEHNVTENQKNLLSGEVKMKKAFFPELQILSLSTVNFNPLCYYYFFTGFFLPKITVLDLSYQRCFPTVEYVFFSTLTNLKELYLCGWSFIESNRLIFLKYLKKLRVLDLGNCIVSNKAIPVLVENSASLEKLYLCFSNVQEIERTSDADFFPCLQSLCLKNTSIKERNIREFLTVCPSLQFVNVSGITETSDIYKEFKEQCHLTIFNEMDFCDHFAKRKDCCK